MLLPEPPPSSLLSVAAWHSATFLGLTTDSWQAIGSIGSMLAFLAAAVAVGVALKQMKQDRKTASDQLDHERAVALDQSRPYVLLTAEPDTASFFIINLVLSNTGTTPAHDVTIKVDPPLESAVDRRGGHPIADARIFNATLPMLPPAYSMAMFFDSAIERSDGSASDLPDTYDVTISYGDGRGHRWTESSTIDLALVQGLSFSERFGVHHAVKELKELTKILKMSAIAKGPLEVVSEGRQAYRDRREREREASMARFAAWKAQQREAQVETDEGTTS